VLPQDHLHHKDMLVNDARTDIIQSEANNVLDVVFFFKQTMFQQQTISCCMAIHAIKMCVLSSMKFIILCQGTPKLA
jgi:hypothetical protein